MPELLPTTTGANPSASIEAILISSLTKLDEVLNILSESSMVSISMKSKNLGPQGSNSVISVAPAQLNDIFTSDLVALGKQAFFHHKPGVLSLGSILQSPNIKKLVFDVRNVSAALWHCYKVNLINVTDIQLLELATRAHGDRIFLIGLNRVMEASRIFPDHILEAFQESRDSFISEYVPQKGGDDERLMDRPISDCLRFYSAMDIAFLLELYNHLLTKLGSTSQVWLDRISSETLTRVRKSRSSSYQGQGKKFKFGPFGWRRL